MMSRSSRPVDETINAMNRRDALRRMLTGAFGIGSITSTGLARVEDAALPVTGAADDRLASFYRLMRTFMKEHRVPGAALAVTRGRRLVYARGFGHADVDRNEPVEPSALFRIASVSKPITAVAVLRLVEKEKLRLSDKVFDLIKLRPHLEPGKEMDPRWRNVTVLHALQHTGGWDRLRTYDPIAIPWRIAKALDTRPPVRPEHIIRYMLGQPLDFDPGARHAYSNLGYLLLGRIIEEVSGMGYEKYVQGEVLAPLGITTMRLGRALLKNRVKGEVRYYDSQKRTGPALVGDRIGQAVPVTYGADNFEAYEAHGGWIASAVDLVRFASAFDVPARCPILNRASIQRMWARPEGTAGHEADGKPLAAYYGCGWSVRPVGRRDQANTWHAGLIGGSSTLLVRRWDGLSWAVLFNTDRGAEKQVLFAAIDPLVHQAADQVKDWPTADGFDAFGIVK